MKKTATIILLSLTFAGSALAQSGALDQTDKEYLMKDRRGATYELEISKLAVQKAQSEDIKSYAKMVVDDHEKYNSALEALGKEFGVTLPTKPDAADEAHLADLKKESGKGFDTLYVKEAARINKEDKQDADKEKDSTKNEKIKSFISEFAQMDAKHASGAEQLMK